MSHWPSVCCRVILKESLATENGGPLSDSALPRGSPATWEWGGCLNRMGLLCRERKGIIDPETVQGAIYKYDLQSFTMFQNSIYDICNTHLTP